MKILITLFQNVTKLWHLPFLIAANIWNCLNNSIRFLNVKIKNTHFMFSTISMLAKNRTSFKSPVATVEDQLLLWSDWLLVVFVEIWLLDNKVENRHFLFMWQHSTQNKWLTWQTSVKQMLWNSSNKNSDIPTRLPRKDFDNNIIIQSYGYHIYHKINFSNYLLRWMNTYFTNTNIYHRISEPRKA
jgi:hypothetical protein